MFPAAARRLRGAPGVDVSRTAASQRAVETLERLLEIPAGNLKDTLSRASDIVAAAIGADKVDGFLYDASRDSLVAVGSSTQLELRLEVLRLRARSTGAVSVFVRREAKSAGR